MALLPMSRHLDCLLGFGYLTSRREDASARIDMTANAEYFDIQGPAGVSPLAVACVYDILEGTRS